MRNVMSNFIYQAIFQLTKIIIPIITVPIISKALGPSGVGMYNYTYSITQYFILFAGLGISLYGSREIAIYRLDKKKLSETFWEIFILKAFVSSIAVLLFLVFSFVISDSIYFYLQTFSLLAVFFDISWFFMGIEDFKKTSMSNLISQILVFICIINFIKKPGDIYLYILFQSIGTLFPQVITWFFLKKYIYYIKIEFKNSLGRIKIAIEYFIPQVSITLYTNLNKTLLGFFVGTVAVGYYSNALTLNTVFITLITTLDTVMLPKMSHMFSCNDHHGIIKTLKKTVDLQLFFSIAIMFGMLTVYDKLVPWFFGNKFLYINNLIPYFSILIVVVPLGMAISRQYLLPIGNTKDYNISVMIGAIISIILNILLLPTIGIFGVVLANIVSESFVTFTRLASLYRKTIFRLHLQKIAKYFLAGVLMCLITRGLTTNLRPALFTNIIQVIFASFFYFATTMLLKVNPVWNYLKNE